MNLRGRPVSLKWPPMSLQGASGPPCIAKPETGRQESRLLQHSSPTSVTRLTFPTKLSSMLTEEFISLEGKTRRLMGKGEE